MARLQPSKDNQFQAQFDKQTEKAATWRGTARAAAKPGAREVVKVPLQSGIGLSGGGIRSAVFCLGALQALAAKDKLKLMDFMSTVSGGGYIGGALQWWWNGPHRTTSDSGAPMQFGTGPGDFPYGTKSPDPAQDMGTETDAQKWNLDRLRANGNYLTPGNGITLWSGVAIVTRAILLNLFIWLPLLALLQWLLYSAGRWDIWNWLLPPLPTSLAVPLWQDLAVCTEGLKTKGCAAEVCEKSCVDTVYQLPATYALLLWIAIIACVAYVSVAIAYAFNTYTGRETKTNVAGRWKLRKTIYGSAALIALVAGLIFMWADLAANGFTDLTRVFVRAATLAAIIFGLSIVALRGFDVAGKWFSSEPPEVDQRYRSRRFFETYFGRLFLPTLGCAALGLVPVVFYWTWQMTGAPGSTGVISVAAGVVTALWGHYNKARNIIPGQASRIFIPIGSALFLYGLLIVAYAIAMIFVDLRDAAPYAFLDQPDDITRYAICLIIAVSIAVAIPSAFLVNTNQIGPGRFYRDRIMEAFMPTGSKRQVEVAGASPLADNFSLRDLSPVAEDGTPQPRTGPYPIINTNVILFNDPDPKLRRRGGENFVLSPDLVGSLSTGGASANDAITKSITLASAIATSGAAANPNSGYIGTGVTRDRLLSIVMMLLNLRLGYWLANPGLPGVWTNRTPNHVLPSGLFALGLGFRSDSRFIELSDGGHFDNLGVYELIRRELGLIVILDGEADNTTGYAALVSVSQRVAEDFGHTILICDKLDRGPDRLVPNQDMPYPHENKRAKHPWLAAHIKYSSGKFGTIIYIKATMIAGLSFKVNAYKGKNRDFPHQSTGDQFFDPEQFEAYRELGYKSMIETLHDVADLTVARDHPEQFWQDYCNADNSAPRQRGPSRR